MGSRGCVRLPTNMFEQFFGQTRPYGKLLRGIIEQSVSVFDGFVHRLCDDLVNSFRSGMEKPYSNNMVEYSVALTHFSEATATSLS